MDIDSTESEVMFCGNASYFELDSSIKLCINAKFLNSLFSSQSSLIIAGLGVAGAAFGGRNTAF